MFPLDLVSFVPLSYAAYRDGKERMIPNWTSAAIALCAVVKAALGQSSWLSLILGGGLIGAALLVVSLSKNGIGGGDIKLCAALGALYGLADGLMILAVALTLLVIICLVRRLKALPLAPFLLAAAVLRLIVILILES